MTRCLKIIVLKNHAPEEGVERVYISGFHIHVACEASNLEFKGLLHVLINPIFFSILVSPNIF